MPEHDSKKPARLSPIAYREEYERGDSAYIDLHGRRFRDEGPAEAPHFPAWQDFTEQSYGTLLDLAAKNYRFAAYNDLKEDRHVLWRHDVDISIPRALRLAQMEEERRLIATYFFSFSLPFYNLMEPSIQDIARQIIALGHRAGLHFNVKAYQGKNLTAALLEQHIARERDLLSDILKTDIDAVSFHDPEHGGMLSFDQAQFAGLVNTYGAQLRKTYGYCSDSNGYWRHKPIPEVVASNEHAKLQVLTHPEWWTPEALPPRRRVERAVLEAARGAMKAYDDHLTAARRENID